MQRLAEGIRWLSLSLLTATALLALLWSGWQVQHRWPPQEPWLVWAWVGAEAAAGLFLLLAVYQLWRGNGDGLRSARKGLWAFVLLTVADAAQAYVWQAPALGSRALGWLAGGTLALFALVRLTPLRERVAYDRIAVNEQDMGRLDQLL